MLLAFLRAMVPRLKHADEVALLRRVAQKDAQALQQLYDQYARLVYSLVYRIVGKQEDAEDLLQEVFLLVWEKAKYFDESKGNVYSWLVALSRNRAIDKTRSEKNLRTKSRKLTAESQVIESSVHTLQKTPLDAAVMSQRAALVEEAMHDISEEQREVIMLAYFGGLSQSEIAQELELPLGTVKTRIRQGMLKLQGALSRRLG